MHIIFQSYKAQKPLLYPLSHTYVYHLHNTIITAVGKKWIYLRQLKHIKFNYFFAQIQSKHSNIGCGMKNAKEKYTNLKLLF